MDDEILESLRNFEPPYEDPASIEYVSSAYVNNPPYQRQLAREHCQRLNKNQAGANNRNAKTYEITYADGRQITIKGLQAWVIEQGYSKAGIRNLLINKWKRYRDLKEIKLVTSKPPL